MLSVLLAGCELIPGPDLASLDGTAWVATHVAGQPAVVDAPPTIRFEGEQLSGTTGCNTFGGGFGRVDGRFQVDELVMTEIACDGPLSDQERRFIAALQAAERIEISSASLSIIGPEGRLDFVPG